MPRTRRSSDAPLPQTQVAHGPPRWSVVLRALREASGATQEGWAAWLGFGRSTLQRWESGTLPPGPDAEAALLKVCAERGLFRTFYQGPLRGLTVSAELIRDLLAEARLGNVQERAVRPTLPTQSARRYTLAQPRTSFIGRQRDLLEVQRLVREQRLVTLTGPGGAGKTRLALQVAAASAEQFADGVWLVDLAAVVDPRLVPLALATALGLHDDGDEPELAGAIAILSTSRGLLVLDNCEHVLEACAHLVDQLLMDCQMLHVLTTTRQPLELSGEVSWPLAGLDLPTPSSRTDEVAKFEAVRLFVERAQAVRPDFALDAANASAVARICRQLDGLPLAIELAAARTRVLAPSQLAERLGDHLRLLATTNVTASPRQQTLRATLDWSYEPLSEAERRLLRRVAVFAGGWLLEAAEAVAGDASRVLDVLTSLVTRSLVVADLRERHARYRLLETVRQYAVDKLADANEEESARDAHLAWCLGLAQTAEPHLRGAEQATWLDQLEEEVENVRAALTWALATPERVSDGLRLAAALRWFWFTRGRPAEGRAWLERGLSVLEAGPAPVRGRALDTAAALAHSQGAYGPARSLQEAALDVWRLEGDQTRMAAALSTLGIIAKAQGEHERARELLEEALDLARAAGVAATEATVLNNLAALAIDVAEYPTARTYLQESLVIKRALGDAAGIATSLFNLGDTAVHLGEYDDAVGLLAEALALFRRLSAGHRIAQTLHSLGSVALRQGDVSLAETQFGEALELFRQAGDGWGQALCVEGLAEASVAAERYFRAIELFGAADAWRQENGAPVPPNDRSAYDAALRRAAEAVGQTAYAVAWADGHTRGIEGVD